MRTPILVFSIATFFAVAGTTVRLQVRAHLRSYEMAREARKQRDLGERSEVRSSRIERLLAPEQVHRLCKEHRSADDWKEGPRGSLRRLYGN